MNDQRHSYVTNLDFGIIPETNATHIWDNDFINYMEILIAECVGLITKNYFIEQKQLAAYVFYPPLAPKQLRKTAIDNVTSVEVKRQMAEKVYKRLEFTFDKKIINWNSVAQTTAKRFVTNAVEQAIDIIAGKLLKTIDDEKPTSNIIVQRFELVNNQLKIV